MERVAAEQAQLEIGSPGKGHTYFAAGAALLQPNPKPQQDNQPNHHEASSKRQKTCAQSSGGRARLVLWYCVRCRTLKVCRWRGNCDV